jgi:hypothetical protein
MNNAFCVHLFSRHERETFLKIEPHLVTKTADCAGAGTIMFLRALIQYMPKEIKILLHARKLIESNEAQAPDQGLWVI